VLHEIINKKRTFDMKPLPRFAKLFSLILLILLCTTSAYAADKPLVVDLEQTVVKMPIEDGISMDDAVESMKLRANILNIKLVAELPLSKQIKAMGAKSRRIGIYQFCDALTAKKMVEYDMNFAAYLPCRIALVEDAKGKGWLVMMNMDMLLKNPKLNNKLRAEAEKVWDNLNEIMKAGASGAL
jgi:uncharacterized protein (DUF302 family)